MEKMKRKRAKSNRGVEENTLAILESFCSYDSSHVHDDRLAFLEAVRSSSIVSENGCQPTSKMMEAIFGIMREEKSLELIMFSYRLLCEIEKHFPRVYLLNGDAEQGSCTKPAELVVFEEAWSPFAVVPDGGSSHKHVAEKGLKEPLNAADFHLLLASLTEGVDETDSSETKLELLAKMILFQYLITALQADFLPRNQAFLANSNWVCLRESFINKLMGSRTINYKGLVKDCLDALCVPFTRMDHDSEPGENISSSLLDSSDLALSLSLPEVEKHTVQAVRKLLVMMMELDSSRKKADTQSLTTRIDSPRTPVIDLIVDELSYSKDMISRFLQAFDVPELKLEIISQYLQKYTAKLFLAALMLVMAYLRSVVAETQGYCYFLSTFFTNSFSFSKKKFGASSAHLKYLFFTRICKLPFTLLSLTISHPTGTCIFQPSTRNRKSKCPDDALVTGILKVFLNSTSAKAIVKKLGAEAVQVLLAHTFQACMSIANDKLLEIYDFKEDAGSTPLGQICKNVISSFTTLKETDESMQILAFGKEAIFTAATILSTAS